MIKSTKVSLKFLNANKKNKILDFIDEYTNAVKQFVDVFWEMEKVPVLMYKEQIYQVTSWLPYSILSMAGKQASGIVRGTRKKQGNRKYIIEELKKENKLKQARKLQKIYDETNISKPIVDNVELELNKCIIETDLNNNTSFDGWVTISRVKKREKIIIPFKKTKHFNKLLDIGTLKPGVRLGRKNMTFMFEIEQKEKKEEGIVLGIDIGQKNVITCSNGHFSTPNKHGYTLDKINEEMARKKAGSKAFQRCVSHRTNYINWCINQLNLSFIKQVNTENIKHLRKGRRTSRQLKHWTYTGIFGKLKSYCVDNGVHLNKVSPSYTSQRCSRCGWTRKANRKGSLFKCDQCGFSSDADFNAAVNISLPLIPIRKQQRQKQPNRKGFYWPVAGEESTVPHV